MKKLGILIGCLLAGIVIGAGVTAWLSRPARIDEDPRTPAEDPHKEARESIPGPTQKDSASSESMDGERAPFVNGSRIASA